MIVLETCQKSQMAWKSKASSSRNESWNGGEIAVSDNIFTVEATVNNQNDRVYATSSAYFEGPWEQFSAKKMRVSSYYGLRSSNIRKLRSGGWDLHIDTSTVFFSSMWGDEETLQRSYTSEQKLRSGANIIFQDFGWINEMWHPA